MTEEWRAIVGYEGRYEVSDLGRVKSLPNSRRKSILVMKQSPMKRGGYMSVNLTSNDGLSWTQRLHAVHLLVLTAFVGPNPGVGYQCCHDDGNPANSALSNLRWDTLSGNQMDRIAHGTSNRGEQNGHAKLTLEQVLKCRARLAVGVADEVIASEFSVSPFTIKSIRNGYNWSWV